MRVPKSLKLFNQTIEVKLNIDYFCDKEGIYGFANYRKNQIILRPNSPLVPVSNEQLEQTFYHELVHFILYYSGGAYKTTEDYMHQDECFVDLTAHLLHQALSTMEYEEIYDN